MYRELDKNEGIELVLRYTETYTCIAGEVPMYTQERLDKLYAYPFNTITYKIETDRLRGVVGFIDNWQDKNEVFLWVDHTLGIYTEEDLRVGTRESFKLFYDYAKSRNKKFLSTRIVKWKDYKSEWLGRIPNWKEIMINVAAEFFVDFKIDDEEVMRFVVK
jgi:hypothetical protein